MENPLSVRANAFAIASIMSDPNSGVDSAAAAAAMLSSGYGYNPGAALASHLHRPSDCRFQVDWSTMQDNGYTSGLKAMEGI